MEPIDVNKKRPRDDESEALIKNLLDEETQAKKSKQAKSVRFQLPTEPASKGKTLAEIENEEGGPVKESMVSMAQTKRRMARSKAKDDAESTELVDETERFEQALQVQEEGGILFEPFSLKQEREEGYFDESGNYVERKNDEDDKDAWLASDGGAVVSDEVREKLQQKQKLLEAAEAAAPLSEVQMGQMKGQMAKVMEEGETVMQALKRLGGKQQSVKALSKREKLRLAAEQAAKGGSGSEAAEGDRQAFLQLTELASSLLSAGELDIYGCSRRQLEREAALYAPAAPVTAAPAAGGDDMFGDDDDDMFGEDEKPAKPAAAAPAAGSGEEQPAAAPAASSAAPGPPSSSSTAANGASGASAAPGPAAAAAGSAAGTTTAAAGGEPEVDYGSWPIKELRRFLQERGVDPSGIVEKGDLVARVREAADKGPEGASDNPVPMGYAYDPSSGYYFSSESGMYYDASTGGFCEAASGKWYTFDSSTQQFVAWSS